MLDLLSGIMSCVCVCVSADVCVLGVWVCFFHPSFSCLSFLGVSKGTGPSLLNVPLLYFVFFFLPIKQQHCGVWSLDT